MHRSRAKFFIEIVIHALFWLGVYFALIPLTASSYSMVVDHGNGAVQRMDINQLFQYSRIVLVSLMLLFYSNTFWLFKKVIRFKNDLQRVAVISGWFMLIFAANYLLIRTLIGPSANIPQPQSPSSLKYQSDTAMSGHPQTKVFFEFRDDTGLVQTASNSAFHTIRTDSVLLEVRPHGGLHGHSIPEPFGLSLADNWSHMQLAIALIFIAVLAVATANFFIKEWIRNDLVRSQAQAQQLYTEVRLLRSQVNPHFLFNTLNNLFSMAQKRGYDELADSISKLSGIMRYMIYESNTEMVPLQQEIIYLKDCIALSKLRYADNEVAVSFQHPDSENAASIPIAPMLFIPFLENAFKHGVSIGHHALITMAITVGAKKLIFTCENTDYSAIKKLDEGKGGIGLENVRRRLELLYPDKYTLRAGPEAGKYTVNLQIFFD